MPDLQIPHIEASLGEAKYIGAAKPEQEIEDTITQNGTHVYEPDPGKALSKVTAIVNVPEQKPEQEKSSTATDNGSVVLEPDTGKVLSKATVVVNVPKEKPEETRSVRYTQNGTNIITPSPGKVMKEIDVQVAVPDIPPVIRYLSVNKNGVYTAPSGIDGYSPISVNCPVAKQEEEKSVKYTANGTNTVTPTPGKVMKSVSVEVAVPSDKKPEEQGAYTFTENGDFTIQPTPGSVFRSFLAHVNVQGGGGNPHVKVTEITANQACSIGMDVVNNLVKPIMEADTVVVFVVCPDNIINISGKSIYDLLIMQYVVSRNATGIQESTYGNLFRVSNTNIPQDGANLRWNASVNVGDVLYVLEVK